MASGIQLKNHEYLLMRNNLGWFMGRPRPIMHDMRTYHTLEVCGKLGSFVYPIEFLLDTKGEDE